MTIRYSPEGLQRVAAGAWAARRLKNRVGEARCETCRELSQTELLLSGPILEVIAAAEEHDHLHQGDHQVTIVEDSCGNLVS